MVKKQFCVTFDHIPEWSIKFSAENKKITQILFLNKENIKSKAPILENYKISELIAKNIELSNFPEYLLPFLIAYNNKNVSALNAIQNSELYIKGFDWDSNNITPFQKKVLYLTSKITFGKLITYKDLAKKVRTRAYRAVGQALSRNPFPLLIPCHRIISKKGIGGFMHKKNDNSPELLLKRNLINWERAQINFFS